MNEIKIFLLLFINEEDLKNFYGQPDKVEFLKTRNRNYVYITEKYKIKCAIQYYPLYRYDLFKKMNVKKTVCKNTDKFYDNCHVKCYWCLDVE